MTSTRSAKVNHSAARSGSATRAQTFSTGASPRDSRTISITDGSSRYDVHRMNSSESERFEALYRRIWGALNRPDDPELSQHERQMLHHVRPDGVALTWL